MTDNDADREEVVRQAADALVRAADQTAMNVFAAGVLAGILMKDGRPQEVTCVGYRAPQATNVVTFYLPGLITGRVRVTVEVDEEPF